MLWSIDSCQKIVSADHFHFSVCRLKCTSHCGDVIFLKLTFFCALNFTKYALFLFKILEKNRKRLRATVSPPYSSYTSRDKQIHRGGPKKPSTKKIKRETDSHRLLPE